MSVTGCDWVCIMCVCVCVCDWVCLGVYNLSLCLDVTVWVYIMCVCVPACD